MVKAVFCPETGPNQEPVNFLTIFSYFPVRFDTFVMSER